MHFSLKFRELLLTKVLPAGTGRRIFIFTFTLSIWMHGNHIYAQEVKGRNGSLFYCQQYTDENGLVQNCINDILPDDRGYLWLATQSGVQYFNGSRFYFPENQPNNSGYLNRVWSLYRYEDSIISQTSSRQTIVIYGGKIISRRDNLTHSMGLLLGNSETIKLPDYLPILHNPSFRRQMSGNEGFHLGKVLHGDTFIVATQNRLVWYSPKEAFHSVSYNTMPEVSAVFFPQYVALFRNAGIIEIYDTRGKLIRTQANPAGKTDHQRIIMSKNADIPAYYAAGSTIFSISLNRSTHEILLDTLLYNFPRATVIGNIWQKDAQTIVGSSNSQGLFIFRKNLFKTLLAPTANEEKSVFYAQALLPDNVTILSGGNLLFHKGQYAGTLRIMDNAVIFTLLSDRNNNLWFGVKDLLFLTRAPYTDTQRICKIPDGIKAIYEAPDSKIWVANGDATCIGYVENQVFHQVKLHHIKSNCRVELFYYSPELGMLMGTSEGIYLLPQKDTDGTILLPFVKGKDVRFIERDKAGNYWIGTYGDGYYLYRANRLTHMPIDPEKRISYVHAVIPDQRNHYIYFPTNHGLLSASYDDITAYADGRGPAPAYVLFDRYAGLRSNEFNGGCNPVYLRLPDGTLSLSSTQGLVQFHSDSIADCYRNVISDVSVDNIWVDGVLQATSDKIVCPSRTQSVTLQVTTSGWTKCSGTPLQYAVLSGGHINNAVWSDIPPSGFITVTGMTYGNHKILVRPVWNDGNNFKHIAVNISIAPLWYQTIMFRVLITVLILLMSALLLRIRYWSLMRHNRMLERHVRAATEDIRKVNRQLNRSNILKNRLLSALSHDIATPLQYIERSLMQLIHLPDQTAIKKSDIEEVADTVVNLGHLTDDLVSWSQLQQNAETFSVYNEPVLLAQLVYKKWKPLRLQAAHKNLSLELKFNEDLELDTDPKLLGIIIYNILSNAIKFSAAGTITVSVTAEGDYTIISITDQGKGFSPQRLQQVNGLLQIRPEKGTDEEKGKGIGLRIIRDLMNTMKRSITINSIQNQGTTVHIRIPTGQAKPDAAG